MEMEVIDRIIADDLAPGDYIKVGDVISPVKEKTESGDFVDIVLEEETDSEDDIDARYAWDDYVEIYGFVNDVEI